eukprot:INCI3083.1.p1 GENE.INCI3083.1~~INCI3083.1.p1  ORF type:complete len:670 (-),score=92.84 INCI3083.1:80-2089(-)
MPRAALRSTDPSTARIAVLRSHLCSAEAEVELDASAPSGPSPGSGSDDSCRGADRAEEMPLDEHLGDAGGSASAANADAALNSRTQETKWNGWGYRDTEFFANEDGMVCLSGQRYGECFDGQDAKHRVMPKFREWIEQTFHGFNFHDQTPPKPQPFVPPPARLYPAFEAELAELPDGGLRVMRGDDERVRHCHGCTNAEVYALRWGSFRRVPDGVCYPRSHQDVERLMTAAVRHNVCVIPFGGGTSVTEALLCPDSEDRPIISVDMRRMNRIKWVDVDSMLACIEAGAVGVHLDEDLASRGLCLGHEPDSREFSTMGGWVATRASGMKKNTYGNIEDIVVNVKVVTPAGGTMEQGAPGAPRRSTGPDLVQMVIGSEGMLGIVTEVVVRLQPLPETTIFDSALFPSFDTGVAALREIALHRLQPTSIRLMDNAQFQFGQVLKPVSAGSATAAAMTDAAKKFYVQRVRGFDLGKAAAASLMYEGARASVVQQRREVSRIVRSHGGMLTGADSGRRGYFLTYMIAYLRDFGYNFWFMAESFETSVPWKQVRDVCTNVKLRLARSCREHGVKHAPFVSCRVTQSYDTGACIYFYFAMCFRGLDDPVGVYEKIEADAREEVLAHGGTLSHHHGVGKLRRRWMPQAAGETGMLMLRALKEKLDPNNILCAGNLGL